MTINKSHSFSEEMNGFQISPRLQELMVYAGQLDCYERFNEVLQQFLDVKVSPVQVYCVKDTYGKEAEKEVNESRSLEPVKKNEIRPCWGRVFNYCYNYQYLTPLGSDNLSIHKSV